MNQIRRSIPLSAHIVQPFLTNLEAGAPGNLDRVTGDPGAITGTTTPPDMKNRTAFKKAPVCLSDGATRQ